MFPEHKFTDEDIQKRYENFYGDERVFAAGWIPSLREKWSSLSEFIREIKVGGLPDIIISATTGAVIFEATGLKV